MPEPLAGGTDYSVLRVDGVSFRVETARGDGAVDLTSAGEGALVVAGRRDALEGAYAPLNRTDL